jgi:VanZ family protein
VTNRRRSAAVPLAAVALGLVVYASLYPLAGWDHPAGWGAWREIALPWSARWTTADAWLNVLGYVPLGLLLHLALARGAGWRPAPAAAGALLAALALSALLETLQNFLPRRVPSSVDLAWNTAGAAIGVLLAGVAQRLGWLDRGALMHDRWFEPGSAGGTTLLLLWPLALLVPTPVALGVGPSFDRLHAALLDLLGGPPPDPTLPALSGSSIERWLGVQGFPGGLAPATEAATVALGLLAPCLLAYTVARRGGRRLVLALGAGAIAVGSLALSTALNFGPEHALAWRTPPSAIGISAGVMVALALAWLPARAAAALGLVVLTALMLLVALSPADPYFALSLQAWEQGRFVRFHGAAQWVGWLWPLAVLGYLVLRLSRAP